LWASNILSKCPAFAIVLNVMDQANSSLWVSTFKWSSVFLDALMGSNISYPEWTEENLGKELDEHDTADLYLNLRLTIEKIQARSFPVPFLREDATETVKAYEISLRRGVALPLFS
jgi:hypothetical protein